MLIEGRPTRTRCWRWPPTRAWAAGRAAGLRARRAAGVGVLAVRGVLARVAGAAPGPPRTRCRSGSATCPPAVLLAGRRGDAAGRPDEDAAPGPRDEAGADRCRARGPDRPARRGGRVRRPGALVGRRGRVAAGRASRRSPRSPRRWPSCGPAAAGERAEERREAHMRQVLRAALKETDRDGRGGLRRLARPGAGRPAAAGLGRRRAAARHAEAQGGADLGAVDPLPAGGRVRLRRRGHLAGLVPPPVHRARPDGRPVADPGGRGAARPRPAGLLGARHRGGPAGRGAGRAARPAAGRAGRGQRGDRAVLCDGDEVAAAFVTRDLVVGERWARSRTTRRRCRWRRTCAPGRGRSS